MAAIKGTDIGKEICDAFGLGDLVQEVHIHIVADSLVTINVISLVKKDQAKEMIRQLKQYELHRKKPIITKTNK